LGTNYADQATRDALETLSEMYAVTVPAVTSTTKGKGTVGEENESDNEDEDGDGNENENENQGRGGGGVVLAETTPGESAARARKCLRRDVEARLVDGSLRFLEVFAELDQVRLPPSLCFQYPGVLFVK
jgi:conserved oligomeric Golgi complex subunit 6